MSDARELAGRVLAHFNNGTTDLAPKQLRIPIDAYTDETRFDAERQAVFFMNHQLPSPCLWNYRRQATFRRKP